MQSRFDLEPKQVLSVAANVALGGLAWHFARKNHQLHHEATHDELTGLLNTRGLEELLARDRPPRAMLYADGTNQKAINDLISHKRGDEAIIGTAEVLKQSLRPGDIAARIGGDEFLVLLDTKRRKSDKPLSPDELLVPVMSRISEKTGVFLGENPDLQEAGFDIAVGGAVWEEHMSVGDLRLAAESAMYDNKDVQHQTNGQHR